MRMKVKKIDAGLAAEIIRKMALAGWSVPEMARFCALWHQSDRASTLMGWLAKPEDLLDRQIGDFIRPFLVIDE